MLDDGFEGASYVQTQELFSVLLAACGQVVDRHAGFFRHFSAARQPDIQDTNQA